MVWVECLHEMGDDTVLARLQLGTDCASVIWMFNATHLPSFRRKILTYFWCLMCILQLFFLYMFIAGFAFCGCKFNLLLSTVAN